MTPGHPVRTALFLLALAGVAAACGGGDPLPAGGPDAAVSDVRISTVEGAAFDGVIWLTREASVVLRGQAPAEAIVEATREADGGLAGSARADADGRYALRVPAPPDVAAYLLRARVDAAPPGPPLAVRVQQRRSPPDPFVVDPLPAVTGAPGLVVQGSAERDVVVVVRVDGVATSVEAVKTLGETRFALEVPLARDRVNDLAVTGADLAGNRTAPVAVAVVQDSTAPPSPTLGPGRPISALRPTLEGRAAEAARVEVETPADGPLAADVDAAGAFSVTASLPVEGENVFHATAIDAAGNRSEAARLVVVRDTVPPADPADLAVANQAGVAGDAVIVRSRTATLVGRAEPGATVEASGEGLFGTATAAGDGGFRVEVRLPTAFVVVTVRVEAVDAAGNRSGATALRVVSFALFGS